jgi:hypothetical protein
MVQKRVWLGFMLFNATGMTRYNIIKFVSDLRQVWFSPRTPVSSTNKTDRDDITEILLKVALNSIKPNQTLFCTIKIYDHYNIDFLFPNQSFENQYFIKLVLNGYIYYCSIILKDA